MFGRFSSSLGLVGVDFGTRSIKMLQVREVASTPGGLSVVGAARIDVPLTRVENQVKPKDRTAPTASPEIDAADGSAAFATAQAVIAEQIRAAFAGGGFTGRRCVVSLAREDVCVQSIRLPKMPDAELRQTAAWEAAQRFGFDRSAMEVDFIRTGATLASGENRDEIILVAASHAAIHARMEPVLAAGLRPLAVDTAFTALVRTFSRRVRREVDQNLVRVVVEIGAGGSTVLILRGDQIAFCKLLPISGAMFNRAVADHLQINEQDAGELRKARIGAALSGPAANSLTDPATDRAVFAAVRPIISELVKEVTLCLRYYGVTFRGHPPERIILTGGDALEPKLDETLAKACKLAVEFDDAPASLGGMINQIQTCLNRTPGPAPCWAAAMGLSLRGLDARRSRLAGAPQQELVKGAA